GRWRADSMGGLITITTGDDRDSRNKGARSAGHRTLRGQQKEDVVAIDFAIPEEAKKLRERVRQWVRDECIPAEKRLVDGGDYKTILDELRTQARAQGLWCPFIPKEYGGMGLGPLANALVQMELGESYLGALSMNTQGPDDATMMTLLEHGTEYQKEKFLKP